MAADGTVWFADHYWPEGSFHALIGRLDPADGEVQEFDEGLGSFSVIRGFVAGPDGNMWFADSGSAGTDAAIGKITPAGVISEYSSGLGESRPETITLGPGGDLWFTAAGESPAIGRATLSGAIGAYDLSGLPREAVAGPDGNVWFTYGGKGVEPAIGRVVRHEDGSVVITLFRAGLDPHGKPVAIIAAGGYLWFSDRAEGAPAVGRVSTSGQITEFRVGLSTESSIRQLAAGPDGNVWFADGAGAVGRVTPDGQITEFTDESFPHDGGVRYIAAGPDGNMWFTNSGGVAGVGKISPSGQFTMFHDGYEGLPDNSSPEEIVAGPNGELWFLNSTGPWSQSIDRIVPGDDSPPKESSGQQTPIAPLTPTPPTGRASLASNVAPIDRQGWTHLKFTCDTTVTCAGRLTMIVRWRPRGQGHRHHAMRVVGRAHLSISPGETTLVRVKLSRAVWRRLARPRRVAAALTIFETSPFPPSTRQKKIWFVRPHAKSRRHARHHRRG